jgi:hypothetical protein
MSSKALTFALASAAIVYVAYAMPQEQCQYHHSQQNAEFDLKLRP